MDREGNIRQGFHIAHDGALDHVDLHKYSGGNSVIVYGQTELTRDLYEARDRLSGKVVHNAEDIALHDLKSDKPYVTYRSGDETLCVDCDYVVGADGFHGVSRKSIPKDVLLVPPTGDPTASPMTIDCKRPSSAICFHPKRRSSSLLRIMSARHSER